MRIDFNDLYNCIQTDFDQLSTTDLRNVIALDSVELLVDYVYLDRNERRKFAQFSHEYLIEQTQTQTFENLSLSSVICQLDMERPVKYLVFVVKKNFTVNQNDLSVDPNWDDFSILNGKGNPVLNMTMKMNIFDRMDQEPGQYFNYLVPYEGNLNTPPDGVNVFSFCLDPSSLQPTGTCNFSMLDYIALQIDLDPEFINSLNGNLYSINVVAINYNFLRVAGGLASLAFLF